MHLTCFGFEPMGLIGMLSRDGVDGDVIGMQVNSPWTQ